LEALSKPVALSEIQTGDALIAFSRRNALMWRDKMVEQGKKVAVIYGALAPEVRRGEARRFAQGEADVLVATDAIGMGLNLPIKRVILTTASKFDGEQTRELAIQELRQIAGRAGRYGVAERGYAGALEAADAKILGAALSGASPALDERASIAPNDQQVEQMRSVMKVERLTPILSFFKDHLVKTDQLFKASDMDDMMELAWRADKRLGLDLRTRFAFAKTPLDRNDEEHVKRWESWMKAVEQGKTVEAPTQPEQARSSREDDKLWECERAMKLLSAYCWLSWRFEESFPERAKAERARAELTEAIERMLGRMGSAQAKVAVKPASRPAQGKKGQEGRSGASKGAQKGPSRRGR
jgi:ATP-dependent RNA helicase SUPV3L1/SUV3